jgi:hypothetical protein
VRCSAIGQEPREEIDREDRFPSAWSTTHDDDVLSTVVHASCNDGSNFFKDNQLFIK